jgi:diaminopimelate decarboxylase
MVLKHGVRRVLRPLVRRYRPRRIDLPLATWGLTRNDAGSLALRGVDLADLLRTYGSPLHVVDSARLAENAADFTSDPRCETFFSYKTNPIRGVLERQHRMGIGAEVISPYELWLARQLGVTPQNTIYNGPAKTTESIREAIESDLGLINVNCREEIAVVANVARELRKKPRIGIRIVVPGGWSGQFGEPCDTGSAMRAFAAASAAKELDVVAIHAHVGGEIACKERLVTFVRDILAFTDQLRRELGLHIEILDFGGSLACPTVVRFDRWEVRLNQLFGCDLVPRPPESVLGIRDYVRTIASEVASHWNAHERPRIFLEPGRAMTGNTQLLLCRVLSVREGTDIDYAVLDAGINVAEPVRNEYHQLAPVGARAGARRKLYRLTGPICTPMDVLYGAWELPELHVGDALAILDSGAYFVPFATSFSFPQPAIALVEDGEHRLLRRAERFEDLAGLDLVE